MLRYPLPCSVIVPDNAPETKVSAIKRYGASIIRLSWEGVWNVATTHNYPPLSDNAFVHPFADPNMIAGNGTIGLEILEELPDVKSVVVPFGGGGLFTGIATAVKVVGGGEGRRSNNNSIKTFASEIETAAPLTAAIKNDSPLNIDRIPSFVDGIGTMNVLEEMWTVAKPLVDGALVVSLADTGSAIKLLLERNRIVAEGASGTALAAALSGKAGTSGKVVCIVSGGNIDTAKLISILEGKVP